MSDFINKPEPKKIKMPAIVDRSVLYDTLSFDDTADLSDPSEYKTFWKTKTYEDSSKDNSQGLSELDSM
ncbi:hypothetical protein EBZ38_14370 [bacterium]|nr:hypothetical protein [bacterium]NDD85443.1 hypothetical protein [bacterium]